MSVVLGTFKFGLQCSYPVNASLTWRKIFVSLNIVCSCYSISKSSRKFGALNGDEFDSHMHNASIADCFHSSISYWTKISSSCFISLILLPLCFGDDQCFSLFFTLLFQMYLWENDPIINCLSAIIAAPVTRVVFFLLYSSVVA